MPDTGIERIKKLHKGDDGAQALVEADPDLEAVGIVQDFLREQKFDAVPSHQDEVGYGRFDKTTRRAVRTFFGLKPTTAIVLGPKEVRKLLDEPPKSPRARYSRLVLKLGFQSPKAILKILSFVGFFEGGFHTLRRNQDDVGLSYGIIHWNQRDSRLAEIVGAFRDQKPALFKLSFGGTKAEAMFTHIRGNLGGVIKMADDDDPRNGFTNRPDGLFNLFQPKEGDLAWDKLFIGSGHVTDFQKIQVELAVRDFKEIATLVTSYASMKIKSQREMAFMIDLSNQLGRGGAERVYRKVQPGLEGKDLLDAMETESLTYVGAGDRKGTKARREFFINSKFLNDTTYNENEY